MEFQHSLTKWIYFDIKNILPAHPGRGQIKATNTRKKTPVSHTVSLPATGLAPFYPHYSLDSKS